MIFTIFLFFRKNEKTPETLDFTGFSGGVFGVPEVIRTPDLPLRRRSLYPAELRKQRPRAALLSTRLLRNVGENASGRFTKRRTASDKPAWHPDVPDPE